MVILRQSQNGEFPMAAFPKVKALRRTKIIVGGLGQMHRHHRSLDFDDYAGNNSAERLDLQRAGRNDTSKPLSADFAHANDLHTDHHVGYTK